MIVVGIAGPSYSGKTTFAEELNERAGFVRRAFADPLVDMAMPLVMRHAFGGGAHWLVKPDLKEKPLPRAAEAGLAGVTWRRVKEELGRAMRNIDPRILPVLWRYAVENLHAVRQGEDLRVVVEDVRTEMEARELLQIGIAPVLDGRGAQAVRSVLVLVDAPAWKRARRAGLGSVDQLPNGDTENVVDRLLPLVDELPGRVYQLRNAFDSETAWRTEARLFAKEIGIEIE